MFEGPPPVSAAPASSIRTKKSSPATDAAARSAAIAGEIDRQLHRLSPPAHLGSLLGAAAAVGGLWHTVSPGSLLVWALALSVLTLARHAVCRAYARTAGAQAHSRRWNVFFVAGVAVSGLLWGVLGSVMYPAGSLPHEVMVTLIVSSMALLSLAVLAPMRGAFLVFVLPSLLPLIMTVLTQGTSIHSWLGLALMVFLTVMLALGVLVSRTMREAIEARFEGTALVARLWASHSRLRSTNLDLTGQLNAQRMTAERLRFVASHDPLTGLLNRTRFGERLQQALAQAARHDRKAAVLFIDLDGFKAVNDTQGHDAGDILLADLARRLRECMREGDTLARMGGDEFVALIESYEADTQLVEVARKILDTVAQPFTLGDASYALTASIGIATFPQNGRDARELLKNADVAMYRAKEQGRNDFRFYSTYDFRLSPDSASDVRLPPPVRHTARVHAIGPRLRRPGQDTLG